MQQVRQAASCRRHCQWAPTSSHPCMRCLAAETRCPSSDACQECLKQPRGTCTYPQVHRRCQLPTHNVPSTVCCETHAGHLQALLSLQGQIVSASPGMPGVHTPCQAWEGPSPDAAQLHQSATKDTHMLAWKA